MTRDEFIALLPDPDGWEKVELLFHVEPADLHHVTANITGDNHQGCLRGAQAVLDVVKGKTAFIRIPPEADIQKDFMNDCWLHRGYVRFSFKDEPGHWEKMALAIEQTTEHRYLPLEGHR